MTYDDLLTFARECVIYGVLLGVLLRLTLGRR